DRPQAAVQSVQRVAHGLDRAGARLEHRRGVDRDPAEAHLLQLERARHHALGLGVEALALGVAGWGRDHALQADRAGIAPGLLRVAPDRVDAASRVVGVRHAARQPAVAQAPDAAQRGLGVAADPDRQGTPLWRLGL